ncbi:hypothetical protein EIY87_33210 [Amycolatopsis eburnea]|uniref:Uncharacterized protein n=2 Tax=Amycolatopsis eburnea TaxID=2267691 RepID=A0A3R9F1P6_9PSEU|nr:hypothetical protein EIY87_33210 [Amycolatopsis eburnea]
MRDAPNPIPARWPLAPPATADWLRAECGDGLTGFMPPAMPDAVWVLNAMYEHELGQADVSYHEYHQARLADGSVRPLVGGIDLEAVSVTTGGGLGRAEHPGAGWRRLRWAELAERTGDPVVPDGLLPGHRCFPSVKKEGSWPLGIVPPTEGSLDRETWLRLIDVLTEQSPAGPDTRCLAYYSPATLGFHDLEHLTVREGRLGDAASLYDDPEVDFSPSNLWAEDRSWCLCTDYDLWGTKVAGPRALIEALLGDVELEAVRLPWAA